nr:unnamed protein product [Callosobruchus chinensis]
MLHILPTKKIALDLSRKLSLLIEHFKENEEVHNCYDAIVIGGGIVGTAIARKLKNSLHNCKIILIEKEGLLGKHQSGHNSGVIHAGIYYKPESLKAKLCVRGADLITKYCDENIIPHKNYGKLIIATDPTEIYSLKQLYERGLENGLKALKLLKSIEEIRRIEPKCKGFLAIWSPNTGNVDWRVVTESFGEDFRKAGGYVLLNQEVKLIKSSGDSIYPILIKCNENLFLKSKYAILCGGLHSCKLSECIKDDADGSHSSNSKTMISMRVKYQLLKNESISTNVYAVPDLNLPFLGVHLSPQLDGSALLGPSAVPAYQIEGYSDSDINLTYLSKTLSSSGFQNLTRKYFYQGIDQFKRAFCSGYQIKEVQKLVHISEENVTPGPTAVQAQYINEDGSFTEDFIIDFFQGEGIGKRIINCRFLPSPAATCSLAIAEYVCENITDRYK